MAGVFKKPFEWPYDVATERENLDRFFVDRNIPAKQPGEIDLATWNIANLGVQDRSDKELQLIAHVLSKFDIIAVQEVRAELKAFLRIMELLKPGGHRALFTDVAGAQERLAVVYRSPLSLGSLVGELDYNPNGRVVGDEYVVKPKRQRFKLDGQTIETYFDNFNRNPFLTTWQIDGSRLTFMIANAHIYFGQKKKRSAKFKNRVSEVLFLAEWAKRLQDPANKTKVHEQNVILVGDMNVPTGKDDDPVYHALTQRGFVATKYSSESGTTIQDFTAYDQVVFANNNIKTVSINGHSATVYDFDNYAFAELWKEKEEGKKTLVDFKAWTRFAISDHRPVFVRIRTQG